MRSPTREEGALVASAKAVGGENSKKKKKSCIPASAHTRCRSLEGLHTASSRGNYLGLAVIIGYVHARTFLEAVGLHDWQTIVRAKTNHTFHSSRPQLQPNEVHANADPGCMNTKLNSKTAPAAGASEESGHTSSVRSTTASVPRSRFNARSMTENAANTPRKKRETHTKEA